MKKILFKIKSLGIGGVERLAIDVLNNINLKDRKIVLMLEEHDTTLKNQISKDIEIVFLKSKKLENLLRNIKQKKKNNIFYKLYFNFLMYYEKIEMAKKINQYIKENKDVSLYIDYSGTGSKFVSKIKIKEKIYWNHISINNMNFRKIKRVEKRLNKYTKIVTICDEMKEEIAKGMPLLKNKLYRIYNFIDEKKINEKIEKEEKLGEKLQKENYCISVGRLAEPKDYETTIKAFKILREKDIKEKLYIVGDGDLKEKLYNLIKEYNLENQVFLLGAKDNPYIYMKYADLFIHSSKLEGFPMVLLEALHIGVPIVSSNFKTGAYDLVEKENNGEIFEIGDYKTLALKIEKFLKNEDKRREYIIKSKEFVKKFYLRNIMKEYENILDNKKMKENKC